MIHMILHAQGLMEIYVADSESSSIRAVDLKTGGSRLLAGGDPIFSDNLFKVVLKQFGKPLYAIFFCFILKY